MILHDSGPAVHSTAIYWASILTHVSGQALSLTLSQPILPGGRKTESIHSQMCKFFSKDLIHTKNFNHSRYALALVFISSPTPYLHPMLHLDVCKRDLAKLKSPCWTCLFPAQNFSSAQIPQLCLSHAHLIHSTPKTGPLHHLLLPSLTPKFPCWSPCPVNLILRSCSDLCLPLPALRVILNSGPHHFSLGYNPSFLGVLLFAHLFIFLYFFKVFFF